MVQLILFEIYRTLKVIDLVNAYVEKESPEEIRILDICSGSGCISLALAFHLSKISKLKVIGIDNSKYACRLAALNQKRIGISKDVLSFIQADIFTSSIQGTFDLIVSNPPYISKKSLSELDPDVSEWEDHSALFAEENGLAFFKRIFNLVPDILSRKSIASVILEIGETQAQDVLNISNFLEFHSREVWKDLDGSDRALFLRSTMS